jgi:hypothetical protein
MAVGGKLAPQIRGGEVDDDLRRPDAHRAASSVRRCGEKARKSAHIRGLSARCVTDTRAFSL